MPFTVYSLVVLAGTLAVLVMLRDTADRGGLSVLGLSLALQAILIALRFGVYFPEADDQTQDGMRAHESMLEIERAAAQRSPGRLRPGGAPSRTGARLRYRVREGELRLPGQRPECATGA